VREVEAPDPADADRLGKTPSQVDQLRQAKALVEELTATQKKLNAELKKERRARADADRALAVVREGWDETSDEYRRERLAREELERELLLANEQIESLSKLMRVTWEQAQFAEAKAARGLHLPWRRGRHPAGTGSS